MGTVAGAGLGLMLASDVTIAAADTRFVFAYADLGSSPDGGFTWFLARTIGVRRALHFASRRLLLALTGHTLHEQLHAEREAFVQCALSDDFGEGTSAFHQRRRPQFTTRSNIDD